MSDLSMLRNIMNTMRGSMEQQENMLSLLERIEKENQDLRAECESWMRLCEMQQKQIEQLQIQIKKLKNLQA